MPGGCLDGVRRVTGGCPEGVLRVSGGYLWDIQMVCRGVLMHQIRTVGTGKVKST